MRFVHAFPLLVAMSLAWISPSGGAPAPAADPRAAAEAAARGRTPEVRDALGFDSAEAWTGGTFVSTPETAGKGAMRWDKHTDNPSLECTIAPWDLSPFNVMSFRLHSDRADNGTFVIVMESQRAEGTFSYYMHTVTVDWTGWKTLEFHFRSFGRARQPAGWQAISRIRFTASGWNQTPSDDRVWILDDLDFGYTDKPYRPEVHVKTYLDAPTAKDFLDALRPEHPRLILRDDELPRIRAFIEEDPLGKGWYARTAERANDLYEKPVRKHELPDGRRLLSISRDVLERMFHWGLMYRLENDPKWKDRAWLELQAVVAFPDWNPSHYLDTAEMMHAVAIGYDWFYSDWSDEQRKTIRDGLWQHGLRLSYAAYMGLEAEGSQGWKSVENNWNFVCNGGTSLAAMAVLDEMPKECGEILSTAYRYIQIPIRNFEPDGAWWEGVGYWGYSMRYFGAYLRGLETAFGTDFGMVEALKGTGFELAGDFPVYVVSPLGSIFNFADSGSGGGSFSHWALFFLAEKFRNPLYQQFQLEQTRGSLYDILYYRPLGPADEAKDISPDKHFREAEIATMRSGWGDPDALFAGIKCGKNGIAHAHQDLGSFILYGQGEKWLIDPGTERQTYLGHQHHLPKAHFYRIREEGHNTLVFDPGAGYCQDPKGESAIVRFESSPREALAVADLSQPYRKYAASVTRGFRMLDGRQAFLVQDEIRTDTPREVLWFGHGAPATEFALADEGRRATLTRNGKRCVAYLLAPQNAAFTVMDAAPLPSSPNPDIQNPNKDMRKLAVRLDGVRDVTITVLFVPLAEGAEAPAELPPVRPIADWVLGQR